MWPVLALRLARFNTQVGTADKRYFIGLASPAAAGVVAGIVWAFSDYGIQGSKMSFLVALMVAAAGMLMVSNIKYNSFKELDLKGRVPFVAILGGGAGVCRGVQRSAAHPAADLPRLCGVGPDAVPVEGAPAQKAPIECGITSGSAVLLVHQSPMLWSCPCSSNSQSVRLVMGRSHARIHLPFPSQPAGWRIGRPGAE